MTVWAYYRVSTEEQDYNSQKFGVMEYIKRQGWNIDKEIIDDGISGTVFAKDRKLNTILKKAVNGDWVITSELSRLGRSTADVINTCQTFIKKGVNCYLVKQGMSIDNTPMGKMMIAILSAFAEMERDLISQRTREALAKKKAEGVILGRRKGCLSGSKLDDYKNEIIRLLNIGFNRNQIAKKFKVGFGCVDKFLSDNNLLIINRDKLSDNQKEEIQNELKKMQPKKYKVKKLIPTGTKAIITRTPNSVKLSW